MNYLLDTHILLWWLSDSPELNDKIKSIINDPKNFIYISVGSIWEISIKKSIGKLEINEDYVKILQEENITVIDITLEHVNKLNELPEIHKDPFDRILICQSIVENITFVTNDPQIKKYPIKILINL